MFPYIKQIKVNDCNTYQDFNILDKVPESFKHIIITGKNGSGKTTILNRIGLLLQNAEQGQDIERQKAVLKRQISQNPNHQSIQQWKENLKNYTDVELDFYHNSSHDNISNSGYNYFRTNKGNYIFSFFYQKLLYHLLGCHKHVLEHLFCIKFQ